MNILSFSKKKISGQKISMVTCYDYPSAKTLASTSIDVALVGDSVAMMVHGLKSTIMATMEMMILHTKAVARGTSVQFIVSDMPFMSHRGSIESTCLHAKDLIQAGAQAIKIEGADEQTLQVIRHLVVAGVPVMGHIGLQPQALLSLGGYKIQGRQQSGAERIFQEAQALQTAGCFAIVLECIPESLAKKITESLDIACIGIGAGRYTDGQVLVWHDLLGLQKQLIPKFVKQYCDMENTMITALQHYHHAVEQGFFPELQHTYD